MDCGDCLERLYPYLDRELSEKELEEVCQHIRECGPCDESFVFERRFLDLVRESCTQDVAPAALRERIVLRLRSAR